MKGIRHYGCHCPSDFAGAHCQYLKASLLGGLQGETLLEDVGDNFWTFVPTSTDKKKASAATGVVVTLVLLALVAAAVFYVKRGRKIKDSNARAATATLEGVRHDGGDII